MEHGRADRQPSRAVRSGHLVRRDHPEVSSRHLRTPRPVTVILPPGYEEEKDRRYPVFYLQDGQNLFEPAEAAYGVSWQCHTTAAKLTRAGRTGPVLLVGVGNTRYRIDEYTWDHDPTQNGGGEGEQYARFICDELKPLIDAEYRTLSGPMHTAIGGSSLGGLIALEIATRHAHTFGLCAALSPALWWNGGSCLTRLHGSRWALRRLRLWVDMGTREGGTRGHVRPMIRRTRHLLGILDEAGCLPGRDYYYWEVAGGEHNEAAWAARFDRVLLYLFGRSPPELNAAGSTVNA